MARGQRDHDRLRARHRGDAAARDHRRLGDGQWRHPAPADLAQAAARRRPGRHPRDFAEDLGADAQIDAAGRQYGTAKLAAAPGYVVGGKTGTAEKNIGGHYYEKKLLSDFVGAFPMHDPKYAILMLVDEPHGTKASHGFATAGWTVVPATSRLMQRIAPILGVTAGRRGIAGGGSGVDGRKPARKAD